MGNRGLRWVPLIALGLGSVLIRIFNPFGFSNAFLLVSFGYFLCGIISYVAYKSIRKHNMTFTVEQFICILLLTLLLVGENWVILIWITFFLFTFLREGRIENVLRRMLECRPLTYLGDISYSIYLWHLLVLWGIPLVLFRNGVQSPNMHLFVNIMVGGSLVIMISMVSYRFIEMPLMLYGKRVSNKV